MRRTTINVECNRIDTRRVRPVGADWTRFGGARTRSRSTPTLDSTSRGHSPSTSRTLVESTSSVPKVDMTTVQERLLDILNRQIAVKSAAPESLSTTSLLDLQFVEHYNQCRNTRLMLRTLYTLSVGPGTAFHVICLLIIIVTLGIS